MYCGLDQLRRFGVPYPDDLEPGLHASVFNPDEVTEAQLPADAREQCFASAEIASNHLLREELPSNVPTGYGQNEAFIPSRAHHAVP